MTPSAPPEPVQALTRRIKVALVTNIPAPYRVPVYNLITADATIELTVYYAASVEPDRRWDLLAFDHRHVVLGGRVYTREGRYIHHNPGLWRRLVEDAPDVVVTTGYNPTHLLAFAYARLHGRAHVPQTDGTIESEQALSGLHAVVRRIVIGRSAAAVVASQGGWRLMRRYGMAAERIHFSPLCANTGVSWQRPAGTERDIDLLFSGRLIPNKRPEFALEVAQATARRLGRRLRIVLLGDGPMTSELQAQADAMRDDVDVVLAGHVAQGALPGWFQRARLFLFPTVADVWGVVANEAFMAEVPVIVSPHAGVAHELVRDGRNGRVLPLELGLWVDAATAILADEPLQRAWGRHGAASVAQYSFGNAAAGLIDAAVQAAGGHTAPRQSGFVRRARVVCVRTRVATAELALLEHLHRLLDERGVEFVLALGGPAAVGDAPPSLASHGWVQCLPGYRLPGTSWSWLRPGVLLMGADLLIVEPVSLRVCQLRLASRPAPDRLAYWPAAETAAEHPEREAARLAEAITQTLATRGRGERASWWGRRRALVLVSDPAARG